MKKCFKCGDIKPTDDFYRHPSMKDGRLNKCKKCACLDAFIQRRTDSSINERERARSRQPHRVALRKSITKKWSLANKRARHAHSAVAYALRSGKLRKTPCAMCGKEKNIHAHHQDYSKPLDVVWLCTQCHRRLHAVFPALANSEMAST